MLQLFATLKSAFFTRRCAKKRRYYGQALLLLALLAKGEAISQDLAHVKYLMPEVKTEVNGLVFRECMLSDPGDNISRKAECAQVNVPENYAQPQGKTLAIFVARLKATAKQHQPDPLLAIAGGPGQAATESFIFPGVGLHKVNQSRDIYLVDQRGTGKSNSLTCDFQQDIDALDEDQQIALIQSCEKRLSTTSELSQYTTSVAVRDLEAVRHALGLESWNIYGVSYGTRVAQHYLRRYPKVVRSVVLDGVVSPDHRLGTEISLQSQRALEQLMTRCEQNAACNGAFPSLRSGVDSLIKEINLAPKILQLENPRTGVLEDFEFRAAHLNAIIRFSLYSPELVSVLPAQLQAAYKNKNFLPLARSVSMKNFDISEQISFGMHASAVCSEDIAALSKEQAQAAMDAAEGSYLGAEMLQSLQTICAYWPAGIVDTDFHQKLKTEVPILLMSGSADPITPPSYADSAAQYFDNSVHLVVDGFAHSVLRVGCMPTLMARFVESASVALDASCLSRQKPAPIFIDFNGPQP